ncbi:uncharacterized protein [Venturia canescens]|uniref:uncharacterized protein n=1 Tax=Venturia canescens TaxID=32260 RepID=UPI001C9CC5E7|nr:uncharacterized protein LOC122406149 [Venturia canescens]
MAAPSPGNCLILLFLVLILYTGYAFRIRDVPASSNPERPTSCLGHAKCPVDRPTTDPSPADSAGTRSRHVDATRGRITNKITTRHQPSAVNDDSSPEILQDNRVKGKAASSPSSGKLDKWPGRTVRLGRPLSKLPREDDDDDVSVSEKDEDDDEADDVEDIDADEDDDSVDGTDDDAGSEEDSTEVIDADADDDDDDVEDDDDGDHDEDDEGEDDEDDDAEDDDDDDDDENDSDKDEKVSEEISDNVDGEDADSEEEERDVDISDDENDVKIEKPEIKVVGKKMPALKKHLIVDDQISTIKDSAKSPELRKTTHEKQISSKAIDSKDGQRESEDDRSVVRKPGVKDGAGVKKVHGEPKKKKVKQESEEDGNEDDDDDSDDGEDEEVEKAPSTPVPMRKLEKVRLADKEKSKMMETPKPVEQEKPVKASPANVDEASTKKKKNAEAVTAKPEPEKSQPTTPTKPETKAKADAPLKTSKIVPSNVKSETPKKSKTTTTITTTKEEVKPKIGKADESIVVNEPKKSSAKKSGADGRSDRKSSNAKKPVEAPISLTQLNNAILQVPTFVPNFTAVEDPACQQHGKIFLRQLRGYKLWALQMLDSSAKIPSGLLRGNINQLGDFDQCLGVSARVKVDEKTVKVQGKYCLATLDLHALIPDMKVPVNFMQSRGFIRASMRDSGHFIPRFTTANWALCIPAACSAKDAQIAIESALSHINSTAGLRFSIDVDPDMCYVRQKYETYTKETIGVLYFYAMIICVVLVATIRDYIVCPQGKGSYSERIIMSFSLRRTWKILTKIESDNSGEISCVHGIRSLATIALYVAHKMIPTSQIPYANRIFLTEIANNPASSLLRTSLAYTDCFLLLSGLLTAFNMARESAKKGEIRWFCRLVGRFIRLTPSLLVMVFWYAYVMEHIGTGPQWHRVIGTNAELCKQNSWTNFLYIQNFFPFEEMCATHTHQLALDMQLSLIAPMLVFFLSLKPVIGVLVIFFILQVSATVRYFATTSNNLSLVIYHGMTMKQLYKTANLTYALPLHRATPYVFGAGLGVLLHYTGKNVRIYRIFVLLGWLIAMALGAWTLFSPWHMARRDYVYDVEEAAHYAVIAPVAWSIALCWTIFACFTEHGGIINKILSSSWMILFSRISYAVYLCQFAIFFYNVGTTRYSSDVQFHRFIDPYEAISVALVSVVLTLLIDIPMQEVKNVMMESTDRLGAPIGGETLEVEEKENVEEDKMAPVSTDKGQEKEELEEEKEDHESWDRQDDAIDGLTRLEETGEEEYMERWRPRRRSRGQEAYVRSERYEDEEEVDEDLEDEEEEEERPTEWSWVRDPRNRTAAEDDGLLEHGRSRSSQRESYIEQGQREDDRRRDRRSQSRQGDRIATESPRSSLRRERSTSRASEARTRYAEADDSSASKRAIRPESRGSSASRDQDRPTTPSWAPSRRERSSSRASESRPPSRSSFTGREPDRTASWESSRHERSPSRAPMTPRREASRQASSESEEELSQAPRVPVKTTRKPVTVEPKVSDEEDWEAELRIRRKMLMERLASEDPDSRLDEGNDGWNSIKRRSSAEGKIALLKEPTGSNVMDSWTVSRGPRVSLLGSSQETEDDISGSQSQRDSLQREESLKEDDRSDEGSSLEQSRRRSYTSGSQVTSLEEEEDIANNDFVLNKDSKRITIMDLSKLSQQEESPSGLVSEVVLTEEQEEEGHRPIMATLKLFKRESIVKSQASEEDPEYLLPERPKLQEQDQDHPFKKAWQLQKSRSEEDPQPYALKEVKTAPDNSRNRTTIKENKDKNDSEESEPANSSSGPQSTLTECHPDDDDLPILSKSFDLDEPSSTSKSISEDSSKIEWPSEDEQFNSYKLRKKRLPDEGNCEWELEET